MFGLDALVASRLTETGAWFDYITLQYDIDHGPINNRELFQFEVLLPHISKSLEISRPMAILEQRFCWVLGALDHFHVGVLILSDRSNCILKNREAERILSLSDGLFLDKEKKLKASFNESDISIQKYVTNAINTSSKRGSCTETLTKVNRTSGKDPFLLEIAPLTNSDEMNDNSYHGSIIFVIDPDKPGNISTKGLMKLYDLTLAESNVCQLIVDGYSNPEIADLRNVSSETIKSQVQSVMRKTGSSNRAELIRR